MRCRLRYGADSDSCGRRECQIWRSYRAESTARAGTSPRRRRGRGRRTAGQLSGGAGPLLDHWAGGQKPWCPPGAGRAASRGGSIAQPRGRLAISDLPAHAHDCRLGRRRRRSRRRELASRTRLGAVGGRRWTTPVPGDPGRGSAGNGLRGPCPAGVAPSATCRRGRGRGHDRSRPRVPPRRRRFSVSATPHGRNGRGLVSLTFDGSAGHLAVVGAPRTGRTSALRTVALTLAASMPPSALHLYAVGADPGLARLEALPHIGAVADPADEDLVLDVVSTVAAVMFGRQRRGSDQVRQLHRPADVVLLIDDWPRVRGALPDLDQLVQEIAVSGQAVGVHLILTAHRWSDLRAVLARLPRLADRNASARPARVPVAPCHSRAASRASRTWRVARGSARRIRAEPTAAAAPSVGGTGTRRGDRDQPAVDVSSHDGPPDTSPAFGRGAAARISFGVGPGRRIRRADNW